MLRTEPRRRRLPGRSETGQATTETLLLSWILLILFAGVYQLFIVNEWTFRAMTAAHARVFEMGYARNHVGTGYNTNSATVVWTPSVIPESQIPIVPIFRGYGLPARVSFRSTYGGYKQLRMGSGPSMGIWDSAGYALRNITNADAWADQLSDPSALLSALLSLF